MPEFTFQRGFGSDNHSGVHPKILASLNHYNDAHAPSYGTDEISKKLQEHLIHHFGPSTKGYFVFNGTAANVLSLKTLIPSWKSVLCADVSHLNVDECGAPEAIAGVKIIPVASDAATGKLTVTELEKHMIRLGDQHFAQPGCLSITQPTELGTVYTVQELKQLFAFAQKYKLKTHIDGARLANACAFLKCDFKEILKAFTADAVSFGGTKNGLLGGEVVLLWNKEYQKSFPFIRKQNLQLPSKTRFIATQFNEYFNDQLFSDIAKHSHKMAILLSEKLKHIKEIKILYPIQSNAVFIQFPKHWTNRMKANKFFYIWDALEWSGRLMTSFDTQPADIEEFYQEIQRLSNDTQTNEVTNEL